MVSVCAAVIEPTWPRLQAQIPKRFWSRGWRVKTTVTSWSELLSFWVRQFLFIIIIINIIAQLLALQPRSSALLLQLQSRFPKCFSTDLTVSQIFKLARCMCCVCAQGHVVALYFHVRLFLLRFIEVDHLRDRSSPQIQQFIDRWQFWRYRRHQPAAVTSMINTYRPSGEGQQLMDGCCVTAWKD